MTNGSDFPGKREDEQTLVCQHRHWLFLLPDILITLVLGLLPVGGLVLLSVVGAEPFGDPGAVITTLVLGLYYLALITFFFIRWLDYYLDLAIVTDKRVVDIDQHGLFNRNSSELEYEAVQDVSAAKHGILQTLFNFGDVEIQTAGEKANFMFRTVAAPETITERINQAREGASNSEDKAAEEMRQAAEEMKEAAEHIKEAPIGQGEGSAAHGGESDPPADAAGGGQADSGQSRTGEPAAAPGQHDETATPNPIPPASGSSPADPAAAPPEPAPASETPPPAQASPTPEAPSQTEPPPEQSPPQSAQPPQPEGELPREYER